MIRIRFLLATLGLLLFATCAVVGAPATASGPAAGRPDPSESRFCAGCHPAIYAEHRQNTHGRAYFDGEARLATRGFRRDDCIRCHTPRTVAETGIGMTPMQRWTNLEEGNTCLSCHARPGVDYAQFTGGQACKTAFDPRVGTVEHCATCHRIAGTPDQWSRAEHGAMASNVCVDCHMPLVQRPVAVGQAPRTVRSHVFPASRSESQLRRAYGYEVAIDGSDVVVRISNKGVGHNFPTANRQRAVESLVIVRDAEGKEVGRSRLVCRYPYAMELEPGQLTAPVSTQIPSGKTREHRVPIGVAAGTVECRLYFKLYRPIDDDDPQLSRCLEERRIPFTGVVPSAQPVVDAPFVGSPVPATDLHDFLSPQGLANVMRSPPGAPTTLPTGQAPEDLLRLVAMLESHLPEARKRSRARLVELGAVAFPAVVAALGHWSNETTNEAKAVLVAVGEPAAPALLQALHSDQLYVRVHAREVLATLGFPGDRAAVGTALLQALAMPNALDRRSAAVALGAFGDAAATAALRERLTDRDEDVVMAAATALADLDDRGAVAAMQGALQSVHFPEAQRRLAVSLARLGSAVGVPLLLDGLDAADAVARELCFQDFFAVTGVHFGYEPDASDGERLEALARLRSYWEERGGDGALRPFRPAGGRLYARAWQLVEELGGGTDTHAGGDDAALLDELVGLGSAAVPALVEGMTFPAGFANKRALVCQALGRIGSADASPWLAAALRDPVPAVTEWACWALERVGDAATLPQLRAFERRIPSLVGREPLAGDEAPADRMLAQAAHARLALGDTAAKTALVNLLVSPSRPARQLAIEALEAKYGDRRGYDADASVGDRQAAARRWRD
jgi:HEAT repeat protein